MSVRTRLEKKGFRAADFDNTDFFSESEPCLPLQNAHSNAVTL